MIFNNGSHYQAVFIDICGQECTNRERGHEPTEVPLFAQIYCTTDNKKENTYVKLHLDNDVDYFYLNRPAKPHNSPGQLRLTLVRQERPTSIQNTSDTIRFHMCSLNYEISYTKLPVSTVTHCEGRNIDLLRTLCYFGDGAFIQTLWFCLCTAG